MNANDYWPSDFFTAYKSMKRRYAHALNRLLDMRQTQPEKAARMAARYIEEMNSLANDDALPLEQASRTGT